MLVEPDLDTAALAAALQRDYGLAASAVRFLPIGETAWCYQVTDQRGGRWFCKLGRPGAIEPARTELALELGRALAELGLPVPRPQATRSGRLWCRLGGRRLALFEFVDGQPLSDQDLSAAGLTDRVAGLAAAVHGATGALALPVPAAETFAVWADGLRGCLAQLEAGTDGADGLHAQARALVWPQRAALLDMQQRLEALGDAAAAVPRELVLGHGDLRGDNLLCDRAGRVWLADRDAAVLAPRERDLAEFAGRGLARFLDGYERAAGRGVDLDADLFAFFLLRRNLDDLVDWLGSVLASDGPVEQRRADLDGVAWCLSRWAALEARIQHARRLLARRSR
jgi:Ser/Thr protein kinase RdoA (MazF antagonist)